MGQNSSGPNFPWAKEWPEITDERVRAAFARVAREEFIEPALHQWADRDAPLPIGEGQTISQPFVVALMTQALRLRPGDQTLEAGTGSGFQTAILCELTAIVGHAVGETVYSIERYQSLSERASETLRRLGYQPHLRVGDGAAGWPEASPFQAIIVTAAASFVPRPLWDQLDEGGRMVIPVGAEYSEQILWLIVKKAGRMECRWMGPVRFVPLVSPLLEDVAMRMEIDDRQSRHV